MTGLPPNDGPTAISAWCSGRYGYFRGSRRPFHMSTFDRISVWETRFRGKNCVKIQSTVLSRTPARRDGEFIGNIWNNFDVFGVSVGWRHGWSVVVNPDDRCFCQSWLVWIEVESMLIHRFRAEIPHSRRILVDYLPNWDKPINGESFVEVMLHQTERVREREVSVKTLRIKMKQKKRTATEIAWPMRLRIKPIQVCVIRNDFIISTRNDLQMDRRRYLGRRTMENFRFQR